MLARGGVVSTSEAGKGKKGVRPGKCVGHTNSEKSTELLIEREFRERFRIPHGVDFSLMDGGPMSIENEPFNATVFSKKQFNVGFCFPLPSFFKQFLHFTKIPSTFLHSNAVRVLMGCSILDMLFHLDISLLDVIFVYIVEMSRKWIFILSAHISSFQLVTRLSDFTNGAAKGHVVSSYEHPGREFKSRRSLAIPGRVNHNFLSSQF